jgi:hypothetical protein
MTVARTTQVEYDSDARGGNYIGEAVRVVLRSLLGIRQ